MFENNLVDLDELVLMVRDPQARAYLGEAISTYRVRAYRSALLATWVAVAYDIFSKIRELATRGDGEASAFVLIMDNAIEQRNRNDPNGVKKLQELENSLLENALRKFEFISTQEHKDLERLKDDRNLCAHPAFTKDSALFEPTAELVRAHIIHAVFHLLRHPPVQGKHALDRLKKDLIQPSFPASQKAVTDFLRDRYLDYAKVALIETLVIVLLKVLIKQVDADLVGREDRVLMCLPAIESKHSAIYERKMAEQIQKLTEGSDAIELKRVIRLFRIDRRCWSWLSRPSQLQITQIVADYSYNAADINDILGAFEIEELKQALLARVQTFQREEKEQLFALHPRQEFVGQAIALFSDATSYRGAESLSRMLLPMCTFFRAEDVRQLLTVAEQNPQIYDASGTPRFVVDVFDRVVDLHPQTAGSWQHFLSEMIEGENDPEAWYAYPDLRRRMERAGMWPVAQP